MKKLRLNVAGITDTGTIKEINEDSFVYKVVDVGEHCAGLFAIADGVGGLGNGEIASKVAISNLNKWWDKEFKENYHDKDYLIKSLTNTLKQSNRDLLTIRKRKGIKSATTLSVLFIYKNTRTIIHIGDSRIYKVYGVINSKIEQLTEDHSCYINKIINGEVYKKSVLTHCIGNREDYEYFQDTNSIKKNETYVLCSDGLYKTMTEQQIQEEIRNNKDIKSICKNLVNKVKNNGEKDNISVIIVKVN